MYRVWMFVAAAALVGCECGKMNTTHADPLDLAKNRALTLGAVQKDVRAGVAQADVVKALGTPSIITKDAKGAEVWVYDRVATEMSYTNSRQCLTMGIGAVEGGATPHVAGGALAGCSQGAGAAASTQRTLTVVIRFDGSSKVESCSYHSSSF